MCQSILLCVALKAFTNWTLGHVTHWLKFHNHFLLTLCAVSTGEVARAKALVAENLFWRTTSTILTGIFSAMSCMKRLSKTSIKQEVLINVESRLLADYIKQMRRRLFLHETGFPTLNVFHSLLYRRSSILQDIYLLFISYSTICEYPRVNTRNSREITAKTWWTWRVVSISAENKLHAHHKTHL